MSDDLRYSLNLFINNFVEADLDSFDAFPDENELLDFAISFNLINIPENVETLQKAVEINGETYNRRIKKEDVADSIEKYMLVSVEDDFGQEADNYSDGYFYIMFTGGMLYDKIAIVTGVEYLGDDLYSVDFNLYNNISGNDGMYGYDTKQMQIAIDNSDGAISYSGTGCAVIDATDLYNYGTYYLDSYYIY